RLLAVAFFGLLALTGLAAALLEGGAQDVAQRCAGIGGAVLRHGFLLFRHFARLDRQSHFPRALVEAHHHGVHLVALAVALGALLGAIARKIGAADEALQAVGQLNLDTTIVHFRYRDGDDRAPPQRPDLVHRIGFQLL